MRKHIKNKICCTLIIFAFAILCSCVNEVRTDFENLVSTKSYECLPSIDLNGIDNCDNEYYQRIIQTGRDGNKFLITKLKSNRNTNLLICPMGGLLSEGEIALCLLIDINKIDIKQIMPKDVLYIYNKEGASVWWEWIRKDIKNRDEIIEKIKKLLNDQNVQKSVNP